MNIEKNRAWLEIIGKNMPQPQFLSDKQVYEYSEVTLEIVAYLKAVRAVQSLTSLPLLCSRGLISDFYTIIRSIVECVDHIYFLLEKFPEQSNDVKQYVEHFKNTTIENVKVQSSHGIRQDRIHSAVVRARNMPRERHDFDEEDKLMKELLQNIWTATCNSVHTNYAEVMQSYGGPWGDKKFRLEGIPSETVIKMNAEWIPEANSLVTSVLRFMAGKLGLHQLESEIRKTFIESGSPE